MPYVRRQREHSDAPPPSSPSAPIDRGGRRRKRTPLIKRIGRYWRKHSLTRPLLAAIALVAVLGAAAVFAYRVVRSRTVQVCVVSDAQFRLQWPNWEYLLKLWFAEVNRIYSPAGVQFDLVVGGDAL